MLHNISDATKEGANPNLNARGKEHRGAPAQQARGKTAAGKTCLPLRHSHHPPTFSAARHTAPKKPRDRVAGRLTRTSVAASGVPALLARHWLPTHNRGSHDRTPPTETKDFRCLRQTHAKAKRKINPKRKSARDAGERRKAPQARKKKSNKESAN